MRVLAGVGLLSLALVARADEPVPAAAEPSPEPGAVVVEVRGAAAGSSAAARTPGAAVTTIDAARFAGEARSTAALLATAPGVAVAEHGGPGQLALVSIRGSSAEQVKVLLDGLPLNGAAGGGVDLSTLPTAWISRIEVVRGTEGVHHGSGALGGVIDVITLPVKPGTWGASATAGSFRSWAGDVNAAAGGEGWGVLGALTASTTGGRFPYRNPYLHRDEVRAHGEASQGGGLLKAHWRWGGGRLDAALQASTSRRQLPGSIQNPTPKDWQQESRGLVIARWRRPLGGGAALSAGAWGRAERLAASLGDLLAGEPVHQRGEAGGGSLGLSWRGEWAAAEAQAEMSDERLSGDGVGDHRRDTVAAVLAGELTALGGRLRIAPGARLERAGRYQGLSAKLGAEAALFGPLSLRASAGRSYRIPSFSELYLQQGVVSPNSKLEPEVGVGGDAALVARGWAGSLAVGGFAVLYDELVVYQSPSFRRFAPFNAGRSSARGLEVEGASAPARRLADLAVSAAYTFLSTETLRGVPSTLGRELPQKPRHRLHGRVSGGAGPLALHADVQWISRRWIDQANTRSTPAVFTLDAGGAVRLWREPDVHLNLEVKNALDARTVEDGFMNPLPGRAFFLTVRAGSTP